MNGTASFVTTCAHLAKKTSRQSAEAKFWASYGKKLSLSHCWVLVSSLPALFTGSSRRRKRRCWCWCRRKGWWTRRCGLDQRACLEGSRMTVSPTRSAPCPSLPTEERPIKNLFKLICNLEFTTCKISSVLNLNKL